MKKMILILMILVSSLSFSWEKIQQDDEFGDPTSIYMLAQRIEEGFGQMLVGKGPNGEKICMFFLPNDYFPLEEVTVKMKAKNGVSTLSAKISDKYVFFYEDSARRILIALRDSDIVKFNLKGVPLSVSGAGFTKMYKNAYWQEFDSSKPINMPSKGEKAYSLYEGENDIEAQDDIWY